MIMAIILIVILSTIMAYTLTLTSQTTKQTGDLYLREQAVLLSQSAAEYALLAISGHNRGAGGNTNCLGRIAATYPNAANPIFDINVTIGYIGIGCQNLLDDYNESGYDYIPAITTPESNGTVLLDITVSTPEGSTISTEPIRYFRRTMQKL